MNPHADNPPYEIESNPLAGGMLQQTALRFYKANHVHAIHYCRPRLKKMAARIYQEPHLRRALQESEDLDYQVLYGDLIRRKQLEVQQLENTMVDMEKTLKSVIRTISVGYSDDMMGDDADP